MNNAKHELGDGPIEEKYKRLMNGLAQGIEEILNGKEGPKKIGFILMMFDFGRAEEDSRCNYISNTNREDVVKLLREQLLRFEADSK